MLYRFRKLILFGLLIGLIFSINTPSEGNGDSSVQSVEIKPFNQTRYDEWIPTIDLKNDNNKITFLVIVKSQIYMRDSSRMFPSKI